MGLSLGLALAREGAVSSLTYLGRSPQPPEHPLFASGQADYVFGLARPAGDVTALILAVPDEVVPEMAMAVAELGPAPEGCVALHCSGALSTEVLAPLHARGYPVGSLHPLQTLASPVSGADLLPGSAFAVSGERDAVAVARRLVNALGGVPLTIPIAGRALYHASAVMASNFTLTMLAASARVLIQAGAPADEALDALLPLVRGTLDNLDELGPAGALTGPIARGDVETVRLHLRALPERERSLYAAVGLEMLRLAEPALDADAAVALHDLLTRYED
jgi:predicted short-subunit dehydrogenase-like oxidoreductase (DUF2520 family)